MITPPSERKLFLIDAYALIFRAYYAFIKNPRINSKGLNTSAIFGFTNALLDVIRNESPRISPLYSMPPGGRSATKRIPSTKRTATRRRKTSSGRCLGFWRYWKA